MELVEFGFGLNEVNDIVGKMNRGVVFECN